MCLPLRHLRILDRVVKTRSAVIADEVEQTGTIDPATAYPRELVQRSNPPPPPSRGHLLGHQ